MKKLYALFVCVIAFGGLKAQTPAQPEAPDTFNYYKYPSINIGAGITGFLGDYGTTNLTEFGRQRTSLNVGIEQRLGKTFGISANFLWGNLSANERQINNPQNFGSKIMNGDIRLVIYWDNDWLLRKKSKFAPYIFGGVGFANFNTKTDLKDADGNNYFYWTDGTVRNLQQTQLNLGVAKQINRDYKYETAIDSIGGAKIKPNTITIPVGIGFRYKLSGLVETFLQGTYYFTLTDDIDARRKDGNDAFANITVGFSVKLGRGPKDPLKEKYKDVDFKSVDNADSDGDGVKDKDDNCANTPAGVKVNNKGCPEDAGDNDVDGVPNYADKEPTSPAGAVVDAEGKAVPEIKLQKLADDSIAVDRKDLKNYPGSAPEKVNKKAGDSSIDMNPIKVETPPAVEIPAKFKAADKNNDGKIDAKEVARVIDQFFDGKTSFDIDLIYELIDYYFDHN